jgi:putative hydrolase of the HAD superfamily
VRTSDGESSSTIDARSIKGIFFDFYLTLLDIRTNEEKEHPWRVLVDFLRYQGATVAPAALRERYQQEIRRQLTQSSERHAEVDVESAFGKTLSDFGLETSPERMQTIAQLFRSQTIERIGLFAETREVIETLAQRFRLAIVSDSQPAYILPELRMSGLEPFFEVVVISAQLGFRKPDRRMFRAALERMGLAPDEVIHVGDTWERDVQGALDTGIEAVWLCRDDQPALVPAKRKVRLIRDLRELPGIVGVAR